MPVKKTQQLDAFAIQYAPNMAIFYLVQENGIAVWERSFTTVEKAEAAYDNGTLADQYVDQLNRLYGRHLMAWRVNWRATPSEAYLARLKWREDEDRAEVEAQKAVDRLAVLFNLQHQLNARIGIDPTTFQDDEAKITEWSLNYIRALQQELAELTDSYSWKWWSKYQKFDRQNARVEVVDCFHFLISIAQVLGMSAEDVFQAYLAKNKVNHNRQDAGYTEKDHADSKHI